MSVVYVFKYIQSTNLNNVNIDDITKHVRDGHKDNYVFWRDKNSCYECNYGRYTDFPGDELLIAEFLMEELGIKF